ncbi:MAG: hypothetical protein M5U28_37580 [Sandaracinaceae bacterium]|nr:hypothetical protein [Sandaracinaceae bacterium]
MSRLLAGPLGPPLTAEHGTDALGIDATRQEGSTGYDDASSAGRRP